MAFRRSPVRSRSGPPLFISKNDDNGLVWLSLCAWGHTGVTARHALPAASRETDNAPRNLYVDARNRLAERMTPAQIAEAQTLAREWQAAFDARQE
jgi:hypothetical protein